ncbi:hypothetical protein, partial [Salmonella enterica]|uniref:hypothetical protein n=1 Tax=Salmonella enterica TaxID=28901 RepID=UPI0020A44CED
NQSHHFCPGRVIPLEPIVGITYSAMVKMHLADESPSLSLIVNRVLTLRPLTPSPYEQVLVLDFNDTSVPDDVNAEIFLM